MIDTCVWLDCAKDPNQYFLIDTLENLVRDKKIVLLVPRIILEEFNRNQERIAAENSKSIASVVGRLKDSLNRYGDRQQKKKVLQALDNLAHKAPFIDEAATEILERIKNLLLSGQAIETSEKIKLAAANRAIAGKAPFHKQKNSIGDAIIIESYSEVLLKRQPSDRYIFVTHNTRDFSLQSGDTRQPHPDIATLFSKIKSVYNVRLSDALKRISPSEAFEFKQQQEWTSNPRQLSEISSELEELLDKIWYNRHLNLRHRVEVGKMKIIPKGTPVSPTIKSPVIHQDIFERAKKAATRIEKKYGLEELGPWSDFEWGMLNGKLSALRWVLGDDWDSLDT